MGDGDPDVDMVAYSNYFHRGEKLQQAGEYEKAIFFYDNVGIPQRCPLHPFGAACEKWSQTHFVGCRTASVRLN